MSDNKTAPIKVLHCIFSMQMGGAETMLVDIINGQASRGADVTLLVVNDLIDEGLMSNISKEVKVIRMNRKPGSNPVKLMWKLNRLILSIHPDITHVHNSKLCALILVNRKRLLFTVHDINIPLKYTLNIKFAAITRAVEDYIKGCVPDAKVRTVINGIHTDKVTPREDRGIPEIFKLVQVARLDATKKGQDILINAISILKKRGITNVEVTFIGDGPDMATLRGQASRLGIDNQIHFEGLRERRHIYANLKDFDAMCHPSRWEGFGLTIAEAMAAGLPIIVTENDGPWEVADNGRLCISVPIDNPEKCADAIAALMSDYNTALRMAAEGRKFAKRYDISNTVDNYLNLYRSIIAREF